MVDDIIRDGSRPDGRQSFEGWFQDLQLGVNECFENPESKTDVEVYLQRLAVSERQSSGSHRLGHKLLGRKNRILWPSWLRVVSSSNCLVSLRRS